MKKENSYKIYKITNIINNKVYIGQTKRNPRTRYNEHLRNEEILKYAGEKYGRENLILEIIEENLSQAEANEKEKIYIKVYNSLVPYGYNLSEGGLSTTISEEGRLKLSQRHSGINNPRCGKKIIQYDLNGNKINEFGSAREAGRFLGNENKYRSISNCLSGKTKSSLGFIWKYEENT